ncbi:nwd2 [Moniliophthora roreri]|nr:nwd2 [Moniliophthora roreri]
MWLYGPAGTGKSAIAQTVSEAEEIRGEALPKPFVSVHCLRACNEDTRASGANCTDNQGEPAILEVTLEEQPQKVTVDLARAWGDYTSIRGPLSLMVWTSAKEVGSSNTSSPFWKLSFF